MSIQKKGTERLSCLSIQQFSLGQRVEKSKPDTQCGRSNDCQRQTHQCYYMKLRDSEPKTEDSRVSLLCFESLLRESLHVAVSANSVFVQKAVTRKLHEVPFL